MASPTTDDDHEPRGLREEQAGPDPLVPARAWLAEAEERGIPGATGMIVATSTPDGAPSARVVLLKEIDDDGGFVFYSGRASRKGEELAANARAALVLWWQPLQRQVRVEGRVEVLPREVAAAAHAARPRESQVSALVSEQSQPIASRETLEERYRELAASLGDGEVPVPEDWTGYRVVATAIELWHSRPDRLHDRLRYTRDGVGAPWERTRLQP